MNELQPFKTWLTLGVAGWCFYDTTEEGLLFFFGVIWWVIPYVVINRRPSLFMRLANRRKAQ